MDPIALLPFIVLIGAMFLMTRSAKKKQRAATQMRDQMQPGTGVRTIGGMYAVVKEIRDDAVLLELEPGAHALFAKNAIGAVLPDEEFDRIVNGSDSQDLDVDTVVPDDASSLTAGDDTSDERKIDLGKDDSSEDADTADSDEPVDAEAAKADTETNSKDAKRDGDSDSK
ncbi:preprotein translocase subunit YajC [Streptomyces iconiensis]|uniref:Preprotein translocase subunit YajC n=1 Tax=Streptomyces iconiensis TaxID=1384038 RepID=A0ABT6ZTG1_9ACTN|nr:preprotein translocase subunit YajC [Streptomyces iconiensis]MDJ1132344.1 preprotein translocase subunit YajC [Streptomyces iconiensis]